MNSTVLPHASEPSFLPIVDGEESGAPLAVIVAAVIESLITFVGLLGNAVVIFVLVMARDRQDTSSVTYVLNLAVADFFFLTTVPFKIAQMVTISWTVGDLMCKLAGGFLTYLNFLVSPLFLMVMSIDRYLAVNRAVSSARLRAPKSSRVVSIIVWIVALCVVTPIAVFHSTLPEKVRCKPVFPGTNVAPFVNDNILECLQNHSVWQQTQDITKTGASMNDSTNPPILRLKRAVRETTTQSKTRKGRRKNRVGATTPGRKGRKGRKKTRQRNKNKENPGMYKNQDSISPKPASGADCSSRKCPTVGVSGAQKFSVETVLPPPVDILLATASLKLSAGSAVSSTPTLPTPSVIGTIGATVSKPASMEGRVVVPAVLEVEPKSTILGSIGAATSTSASILGSTGLDLFGQTEASGSALSTAGQEEMFPYEVLKACLPPPVKVCQHADKSTSFRIWVLMSFFYSYVIPCAIIVICYLAILRKLYQPSGMLHGQETSGRIRRHTMRKKVTLMVAMLVLSYIICFTPYYVWQLLKFPGLSVSNMTTCSHMERFNELMVYVNSALNPLLYTFLSDQFGSKFRLAWRRLLRRTARNFTSAPMTVRERNVVASPKISEQKYSSPMIPRDSMDNTSENCNGSNLKNRGCLQPLRGDESSGKKEEAGDVSPINNDLQIHQCVDKDVELHGRPEDVNVCKNHLKPLSSGYESDNSDNRKKSTADSIPLLTIAEGERVDDCKDTRSSAQLRPIVEGSNGKLDHGSPRLKQRRPGHLFSCVCDCEDDKSNVCPQCTENYGGLKGSPGVVCDTDDVIELASEPLKPRQRNSNGNSEGDEGKKRIFLCSIGGAGKRRSQNETERKMSTSSQKLCRKHKKQARRVSNSEAKKGNQNSFSRDFGRWMYSTSARSDSKCQTEYTAVTPI